LVIGFTTGDIPKLPFNLALLKGCALIGVFYGAFQDKEPQRFRELMDELTHWLADGRIKPRITVRYPLEQAAQALIDLKERRATGKLIIFTERGREEG
jgi:NADPH2:quinone reductase